MRVMSPPTFMITMGHVYTFLSVLAFVFSGFVFVESRYASGDEFKNYVAAAANYHLEGEVQRAQDKLEGLLVIPETQRQNWQKREILRLRALIARKIRELQNG